MVRFALSDPQDQSAAVWIVTFMLLSYTTLTTLVRGLVKLKAMGPDDGAAGLAQLIAFGHVACMIYALVHGFAKLQTRPAEDVVELDYGKALQASIVLYILTLAAAKIAVVLFLRRAFRRTNHTHAMTLCNISLSAVSLWGIGASFAVSVGCGPEHIWRAPESTTCDGDIRWLVVTVLDGATEIGILAVTIWLVRQLHMKWIQQTKVVAAFAWRLPLVVLTACHYRSYYRTSRSPDADIAISRIVIWEQVSMVYSLLSITWPFSKSFINSFDTAPLEAISTHGSGALASGISGKDGNVGSTANISPWDTTGAHSMVTCTRSTTLKGDNESFGSEGGLIVREHHEVAVTWDDDDEAVSQGPSGPQNQILQKSF